MDNLHALAGAHMQATKDVESPLVSAGGMSVPPYVGSYTAWIQFE